MHPYCNAHLTDDLTGVYGIIMVPLNWRDLYYTQALNEYADDLGVTINESQALAGDFSKSLVNQHKANNTALEIGKDFMDYLGKYGVLFLPNAGFSFRGTVFGAKEQALYWTGDWCSGDYRNTAADMVVGDSPTKKIYVVGQRYVPVNRRNVGKAVRPVLDLWDKIQLRNITVSCKPEENANKVYTEFKPMHNGELINYSVLLSYGVRVEGLESTIVAEEGSDKYYYSWRLKNRTVTIFYNYGSNYTIDVYAYDLQTGNVIEQTVTNGSNTMQVSYQNLNKYARIVVYLSDRS